MTHTRLKVLLILPIVFNTSIQCQSQQKSFHTHDLRTLISEKEPLLYLGSDAKNVITSAAQLDSKVIQSVHQQIQSGAYILRVQDIQDGINELSKSDQNNSTKEKIINALKNILQKTKQIIVSIFDTQETNESDKPLASYGIQASDDAELGEKEGPKGHKLTLDPVSTRSIDSDLIDELFSHEDSIFSSGILRSPSLYGSQIFALDTTINGNNTITGNNTVSGSETISGSLSAGATTLSTVSTSGAATLNSASVTNNATVGGTLGVTGASTLSGDTSVGGTLGVTGATTLSTVSTSGATTLNSTSVTNNATVGGTLGVTGATTLSTVSTSGAATLNSASITNNATVGGTLSVTGASTFNSTCSIGPNASPHFFGQKTIATITTSPALSITFTSVSGKGARIKINAFVSGTILTIPSVNYYEGELYIAPGSSGCTEAIVTEKTVNTSGSIATILSSFSSVSNTSATISFTNAIGSYAASGQSVIIFYEIMSDNVTISNVS